MKKLYVKFTVFMLVFMGLAVKLTIGAYAEESGSISIKSSQVEVIFNSETGQPTKFINLQNGGQFAGDISGANIRTVTRRISDKKESSMYSTLSGYTKEEDSVTFTYNYYYGEDNVGNFDMTFQVNNQSIFISYDNVTTIEGFNLIEIAPRSLVSVREEEGQASFVYNTPAGRLVPLHEAQIGVLGDDGRFNGVPNASVLPVTAFIDGDNVITMEVLGYTSNVGLTVTEEQGYKRATMGVSVQHKIRGGKHTPDLDVNQKEICRIDLVSDYDSNGEVNWIDAAHVIKDWMPSNPAPFFEDQFIYVLKGEGGRKDPSCTFNEAESLMRRVNSLTDGNPQVSYIAGWAEGGHDTAYPNYTKINNSLGGEDGFLNLRDNVKAYYNGIVSFDDNFDDQYDNKYSKGFFDPAEIARTKEGRLEKHKAWNGIDKSHITGMAKYMRQDGPGEERIDYTAEHYALEKTVLIDALSWWSIRHDWDPNAPASAVKNLVDGKFKIIDRYKEKHGIDVSSEMLRYPFIGKLGLTLDGMYERDTSYGGAGYDIPFTSFVLRDTIVYGGNGGLNPNYNDPKGLLFDNTRRHAWLFHDTTDQQITDLYFFNYVPWFKIHDLEIETFNRNGSIVDMSLSNNTQVHINYGNNTWFVDYEGKRIWTNYDLTCPIGDDRIAFYSKTGGILRYPVPEGVDVDSLRAKVLYRNRHDRYPFRVDNGEIIVEVKPQVPVILYLNDEVETNYILNDDSHRLSYSSGWGDFNNRGDGDFNKDVHATRNNGSSMTFEFEGTGVDYISEKNDDMGNVDIYIDGRLEATINCYSPDTLKQQVVYSNRNLLQGTHTLEVVKKDGEWCLVDAIRVFGTPEISTDDIINDDASFFRYSGDWQAFDERGALDFNNDIMGSRNNGDFVEFTFEGTGVEYITEKYKDQGQVDIFIDDVFITTVNCWSEERLYQQKVFEIMDLDPGEHKVRLTKKSGEWLLVDAMKVY